MRTHRPAGLRLVEPSDTLDTYRSLRDAYADARAHYHAAMGGVGVAYTRVLYDTSDDPGEVGELRQAIAALIDELGAALAAVDRVRAELEP